MRLLAHPKAGGEPRGRRIPGVDSGNDPVQPQIIEGEGASTSWSRLGHGLPNAAVDDLTQGPDNYIYAATHGRGVWRIAF